MKITYLYVKEHNQTGLKYFGKTTQDPFKYCGSGLYWKRHLKVHGNDVETIIIGEYTSKEDILKESTKFSTENNIVESSNWANMKIENGLDGGFYHSDELHNKFKLAWQRRRLVPVSDETRQKMSQARKGKPSNAKGSTRTSASSKRAHDTRINNGTNVRTPEQKVNMSKPKSDEHKQKISLSLKGKNKTPEHRLKLSESRKSKPRGSYSKRSS